MIPPGSLLKQDNEDISVFFPLTGTAGVAEFNFLTF